MIGAWIHQRLLKHSQRRARVSVPMFDPGAKGVLIECDCGKVWAL